MGACLYGFELLQSRVIAPFVAGTSRVFLICFGVHYWYLGHCISYAVVGSVLLGAAVTRHLSVTNPLAARRDALQSTVIRLREGFRRKEQNSSSTSSEGCGSSVKRNSSAETSHLGNNWNNVELVNSEKSLDSGRPSLALRSSSCRSVIHESATGNFDHNGSLVVCSSWVIINRSTHGSMPFRRRSYLDTQWIPFLDIKRRLWRSSWKLSLFLDERGGCAFYLRINICWICISSRCHSLCKAIGGFRLERLGQWS